MYCKICGQYNDDKAARCVSCGNYLQDVTVVNGAPQSGKHCPKCGAYNCQTVTDTYTKGKDYGAGKGCCGYIIFGPIGLLCGLCGSGKTTTTKHFWVCPNCNHKFRA